MRRTLRFLPSMLVLLAMVFVASLATRPTLADSKMAYPKAGGHVNDFAGVLLRETRITLETTLRGLATQTGVEIAVVTLPSLNDEPIDYVAEDLFKQWGIGQAGKDNGLLFLIAPNERKMRIEVGYGLEGRLPDAMTGRILDAYVLPEFKKGDMNAGIRQGTEALARLVAESYKVDPATLALPSPPHAVSHTPEKAPFLVRLFQLGIIIFLVILFIRHPSLFLVLLFSGFGGGGGGRSSGGFGGGFGGFGGGGSGGGGSSRSW